MELHGSVCSVRSSGAALGSAISPTLSPAGTGVGARQSESSALRAAVLIPWVNDPSALGRLMDAPRSRPAALFVGLPPRCADEVLLICPGCVVKWCCHRPAGSWGEENEGKAMGAVRCCRARSSEELRVDAMRSGSRGLGQCLLLMSEGSGGERRPGMGPPMSSEVARCERALYLEGG